MRHARADYNRIQDPENLIGEDEPVFLIRGKDAAAPFTIRAWAERAANMGAPHKIVQTALQWAIEVEKWQKENGSKIPDMP